METIRSVVILTCLVLALSQSGSSSHWRKRDVASCLRSAYKHHEEYKDQSISSTDPHAYSRHQNLEPKPYAKDCHNVQMPFAIATQMLCDKFNLSAEAVQKLRDEPVEKYVELKAVQACKSEYDTPQCDASAKYRTFDGSCNNLAHPRWGATYNCYQRFLAPNYVGESGFRRSLCGGPLPNPRKISLLIHCQCNRPGPVWNHLFVYFGQVVAHEMSFTPDITAENNARIECCQSSGKRNPACCPIPLSRCDPFYSKFNSTCMNVVRSAACPCCRLGYREQFSQVSTPIDASIVYSSNKTETGYLREYRGGKLKCQDTRYGDFLPRSHGPQEDEQNDHPKKTVFCYIAGDGRVNQHAALMGFQTILMRDHNRLCKGLSALCPKWNDEKLYQESRRIMAAQLQLIIFREYLTHLLGPDLIKRFNLAIKKNETTKYDPTVDLTMWVESATAAFRMGHSMVGTTFARGWPSSRHEWLLKSSFFKCSFMYDGMLDSLFPKMTVTPGQSFDKCVERDLSEFSLRYPGESFGEDLGAVDLVRSLDHGVGTYADMVAFCTKNATVIKNWADLYKYGVIKPTIIKQLQKVYCDVRDIHLWTGILCETPLDGAVVGPTAGFIIGVQFKTAMYGDRFHCQHEGQTGSFTPAQREALKGTSLSGIICANTKAEEMPPNAMLFPNAKTNPVLPCWKIKNLDLSAWKGCE